MAPCIHVIILAAGQSSRFGRTKLLEKLDGKTLVRRSLEIAHSTCPGNTWLVTGHSADSIVDASGGIADHVVHNPDYADGIGSSIACGVYACLENADAIIIMLADQPLITGPHLSELIRSWSGRTGTIVATGFSNVLGPPVLFGRDYFDELGNLSGDAGARQVLERHPDAVMNIRFDQAAIDIDSPADLDRLIIPE